MPIVVPEMVKCSHNLHEMSVFYDYWIKKTGTACITGFSHFGKQFDNVGVMSMAPAMRNPCHRLSQRTFITCSGDMLMCDQDFRANHVIGNIHEQNLSDLWQGKHYQQIRSSHKSEQYDITNLCQNCEEWMRP